MIITVPQYDNKGLLICPFMTEMIRVGSSACGRCNWHAQSGVNGAIDCRKIDDMLQYIKSVKYVKGELKLDNKDNKNNSFFSL